MALFISHDGGVSYNLWSDSWKYVNLTTDDSGCAITLANSLWDVGLSHPAVQLGSLPAGTPAGRSGPPWEVLGHAGPEMARSA